MADYTAAEQFILQKLERELSPQLHYHSIHHTLDVLQAAIVIGESESVTGHELSLLRIAALFHDSGFIYQYKGHEERGCILARENLPGFGFTPGDVEAICGMIMATIVPQGPHNILEQIICDADLDYLGRDEYYVKSEKLYREFMAFGIVHNKVEWNALQLHFFESHHYHTAFSLREREPLKQYHLEGIKKEIAAAIK
ncbi:MAG TPA: HD domain-containing protein [Agriterribacter sp.]|nr:HD domain-containing protein [Agriterribacter sp.]